MVNPHTDRIASLVAATILMSVVALCAYRRGADSQRGELPRAVAPAAVSPDPGVIGTASPSPAPADPPPLPTVRLPCVDDRAELRTTDGGDPVVCWGDRCLDQGGSEVKAPARPATAASEPAPVVGPEQVCTGTRCDRLGRRLRRVLAKPDPDRHVTATRDHAAIVIQSEPGLDEIWNRVSDQRIDPGESPVAEQEADTHPESIEVLGNFLLVAWGCHEPCSSVARILDSSGQDLGTQSVDIPPAVPHGISRIGSSIFAVDADRYLVFGMFGELALIEGGQVVAQNSLVASNGSSGDVDARAILAGEDRMNALWCRDGYCHVSSIAFTAGKTWWEIEIVEHGAYPRCSGAGNHAWPPQASAPAADR